MPFVSPFGASTAKPGHGLIVVEALPPDSSVLRHVSYQYPLKLVAPDPLPPPVPGRHRSSPRLVHTVFLLTYGGGIVAGDAINLEIRLHTRTRLVLLTQGSTKIFKTPDSSLVSKQHTNVILDDDAALVYLPDPVQPFAHTAFAQSQTYQLRNPSGSLCACDWVTSGRSARGENWEIHEYKSRNEVWSVHDAGKPTLLLRDNLILDKHGCTDMALSSRMDGYSVFGTLIIRGPTFSSLAQFFFDEFEALPRIGGRDWTDNAQPDLTSRQQKRHARQQREKADGLVWSAAKVRGFVLIKFASREVQGARTWLRDMVQEEGSVLQAFGERAILCLK
ncbi:hypothetical protein ACEQ8H_006579 [Pleosporales sp. CAS-2024a]